MKVIWDPQKARHNLHRHGVRFSDAEAVLFDSDALTVEDLSAEGEQRFVSMGMDPMGRLLVVVWTFRDEDLRLISARRATRKERRQYEARVRF